MAQKVNIELVDDLDGSAASESVTFALDGIGYEIDLNEKNAAALRKALGKYVENARRTGKVNGAKGARKTPAATGPNAREVRAWAQSNGYDVPDRGRIPADVLDAFNAAS